MVPNHKAKHGTDKVDSTGVVRGFRVGVVLGEAGSSLYRLAVASTQLAGQVLAPLFHDGGFGVEANDSFQRQFSPSCNFSKVV